MIDLLDRSVAPEANEIEKLTIVKPEKITLPNGIPFYSINAGSEDVVRVEVVINAGNWFEESRLSANAVNSLLVEGNSTMTGSEIADFFDFHGAFLQTEVDFDKAYVTLYCLNKHLETLLPVFTDVIFNPTFPQSEVETFIANNKQKLAVNKKKNDYEARKIFNEKLFGSNHPYGFNTEFKNIEEINRANLVDFHQEFYTPSNCTLIVAGKLSDHTKTSIARYFGNINSDSKFEFNDVTYPENLHFGKYYEEKKDALQTAMRVGKKLVGKKHPDYIGLQILNTLLGGYFGSRLMANIREEKGYTYGIGSRVVSLQKDAYFFISTEVGKEVHDSALQEIFKEIERLQVELVEEQELDLVRNYLLGTMLGSIENAFSHADKLKGILFYDLDYTYYDRYIDKIKTISAEEIQQLAINYLKKEEFISVLVG